LWQESRVEAALPWYQRASDAGDGYALQKAVDMLNSVGEFEKAQCLLRYGWEPDGSIARPWRVDAVHSLEAVI
jgi:hypothetical protein